MTYPPLTATTKISELPAALNGVTTRNQALVFDTDTATATSALVTDVQVWKFSTNDIAYANWPIPDRIDRAVDMTLKILGAPNSTEFSKQISLDIKILSIDPTAGTVISGTTGTAQIIDQSVVAIAARAEEFTVSLPAATYLGDDVTALGIEITRVAASTDLFGDWNVVSAEIQFTIER